MHRFLEVDRVEDADLITFTLQQLPTLNDDTAFCQDIFSTKNEELRFRVGFYVCANM